MAKIGLKSAITSKVPLPDADSLTSFFEQLRAAQYRLNPQQLAAAYRILLSAHAENWSIGRLQFVLMILLAKTKQEQLDFTEQFDLWLGISPPPKTPRGLATWIADRNTPIIFKLLVAIGASLIAVTSAFRVYSMFPGVFSSRGVHSVPTQVGLPPEIGAAIDVMLSFVLRASAVIPLAAFVGWIFLKQRRRALWVEARARTTGGTIEFDQMEVPAALGHVFGGPDLFDAARELRRHRPVPWLDLDIERTVESTARQAGHFSAVWRQRIRRPEYVVLIEENGRRDHVARILDAGLDALEKLGVWIQRYYYSGDPRVVVRDTPSRTAVSLAALGERERHTRLLIFGSGRGLVSPLTHRISPRMREALQSWSEKTFLSTEPVQEWAEREQQLLRDGFSVGTASIDGLVSLATRVAQGNAQGGELLDGQLKISRSEPVSATDTTKPVIDVLVDVRPRRKDEASRWRESLAVYLQPRVLIVMLLGFSSGLPLALSGSTLQVWMREAGVDLGTIGLFALIGTPYTLKFLWAPLVDALHVPLFTRAFGRRRGWLLFSQLLLIVSIVLLALTDPARSAFAVAVAALLVATASSTQDIVVDAFRVESLPESEQAAGMAGYVAAYRIGMLVSTAGALFIVSGFESAGLMRTSAWMWGYVVMAAMVVIGTITALGATEPSQSKAAEAAAASETAFSRVLHAAIGAFSEFLSRRDAFAALAFVVLFKFTDAFSGTMTAPFVIDLGFSRVDYAAIVKGVGLAATLVGGFAGGFVARRYSLATSLWIGGSLQALANLSFSWLAHVGVNQWALALAICAENFTSAIGTVIFVAYLSALCQNPLHTATQYALLTALAAVGRTYLSSGAGYVAKAVGWPLFFVICTLAAVPGLLLLAWLQKRGHFERGAPESSVVRLSDALRKVLGVPFLYRSGRSNAKKRLRGES